MTIEDPIDTLVRLIKTNMRLVNDDGTLGKVQVSREWYDRELLKNYNGQVTVGLRQPSRVKPLNLDHSLYHRILNFKVDCWAADKTRVQTGERSRSLLVEEILRIIREKRFSPNETKYDFIGLSSTTTSHKAYSAASTTELEPTDPGWAEISDADYVKLWYSDDTRMTVSTEDTGKYPMFLFRFKLDRAIGDPQACLSCNHVSKIKLVFEGYGYNLAGQGLTIKAWNYQTSSWDSAQTDGQGPGDSTLTATLVDGINYVWMDLDTGIGYIYLLARTTNPRSLGVVDIYCDYAKCVITVEGLTHVKFGSYHNLDDVTVKPVLFHTEFMIIGWMIETVLETET